MPLPQGTTSAAYLAAFDAHAAPALRRFAPDLIIAQYEKAMAAASAARVEQSAAIRRHCNT